MVVTCQHVVNLITLYNTPALTYSAHMLQGNKLMSTICVVVGLSYIFCPKADSD